MAGIDWNEDDAGLDLALRERVRRRYGPFCAALDRVIVDPSRASLLSLRVAGDELLRAVARVYLEVCRLREDR